MSIDPSLRRRLARFARALSLVAITSAAAGGAALAGDRWSDEQFRGDEELGEKNVPFVGYGHQRTQSGVLIPAPGYPDTGYSEPRYPHGAEQRWIPGHYVGGYWRNGAWVHRRWVPGRTVIISDID